MLKGLLRIRSVTRPALIELCNVYLSVFVIDAYCALYVRMVPAVRL